MALPTDPMPIRFSRLGARQRESDIARLMTTALERPELLSLAAGFTDTDSLPLEEVTRIAKELGEEGDKAILQYGSNQGRHDLRELLTRRLAAQDGAQDERGYAVESSFITNGSQQALYLAVQTLCDPGDVILVERPTYFVFLELLRGLGVEAVSMPMRPTGEVDVDALREQLGQMEKAGQIDRVKALYLVSYYANPSGHSVSFESKKAIVSLLAERDGKIALLEDAAYRELYYANAFEAVSSLDYAIERGVPTCYTTTLTKPFASGLKVGYAYCTHADWLRRMLAIKGQQDFGSAHYPQAIAAKVLGQGLFDEHLKKIRRSYLHKMEVLDAALRDTLSDLGWRWDRPEGGLYLWLAAPDEVTTDFDSRFHQRCIEHGVMYVPGDLCFADGVANRWVRLSFGVLDSAQLREAGRRFAAAAKTLVKAEH